ncbi:sigma-E factor negative regulatory protein [Zoogloea sp.]|uniref:sigma-E factor negative regulatory protein n=1 Tax=Zoogloea sp. TaxID=49181 RepID=UPI001416E11E|nr:MAG: sigma-E factor negative regulatory protein [Zoogloea sp.]
MKEKVSALLDGALDETASERMLDTLKRDPALRREWERYSLIGDVMRDEPVLSADFTSRLMAELEQEPTVLAPVRTDNRNNWVRHLMPIAASVMGAAAVGWVAMMLNGGGAAPAPSVAVVKAPVPAVAAVDPAVSARLASASAEPSEREYLIAHQAMAPSAAMPGVAYYVRSVSDTRMAGER